MASDIFTEKKIAGVDEVGRGSWAGPVVSAAVILGSFTDVNVLKDSKKLSRLHRENIFKKLKDKAYLGIGFASVSETDLQSLFFLTF